jgi:hypothetical protein
VLRALEGRGGGAGRRIDAGQSGSGSHGGEGNRPGVEDGPDRWAPPVSGA